MDTSLVRDLFLISLICNAAALAWAGWGQASPPTPRWQLALRILSWAAAVLTAASLALTIAHWRTGPTGHGISRDWTPVLIIALLTLYIGVVGAVVARRLRPQWSGYSTPWVLFWFAIAIGALVWPTTQAFLVIAGGALAASAIAAALLQRRTERRQLATQSSRRQLRTARTSISAFWCGILAAPVLLLTGGIVLGITVSSVYA